MPLVSSCCTNYLRVFQKISSRRLERLDRLPPLKFQLPQVLGTLKVVANQLICLRPLPRLAQVDVVVLLAALELEATPLEGRELARLQLVDWATSTSYEIIRSSSNFDKSCNKTLKCSSLSCNKSGLEIHNWPSSSANIPNSSYNFLARMETMMRHSPQELKLSASPKKSAKLLRE